MKHLIEEIDNAEKCELCEKTATHKLETTVWSEGVLKASLTGNKYSFFMCCDHFVNLVKMTQSSEILQEVKDSCFG